MLGDASRRTLLQARCLRYNMVFSSAGFQPAKDCAVPLSKLMVLDIGLWTSTRFVRSPDSMLGLQTASCYFLFSIFFFRHSRAHPPAALPPGIHLPTLDIGLWTLDFVSFF
jgi:hypothetical protein